LKFCEGVTTINASLIRLLEILTRESLRVEPVTLPLQVVFQRAFIFPCGCKFIAQFPEAIFVRVVSVGGSLVIDPVVLVAEFSFGLHFGGDVVLRSHYVGDNTQDLRMRPALFTLFLRIEKEAPNKGVESNR
jgi:hypothetical protein